MKKLIGKQSKLDLNKNGKLDAEDFRMLRGKKMQNGGGVETIEQIKKKIFLSADNEYKYRGSYIIAKSPSLKNKLFDVGTPNGRIEYKSVSLEEAKSFIDEQYDKEYANGGQLNEMFPENDAMSYDTGGGISDSDFERDYKKVKNHIKEGYGNIDSDYVEYTWENLSDITYSAIEDKLIKRLRKDGLLKYAQGGSTSGWCYSIGGL
jgi:hypothetical protein